MSCLCYKNFICCYLDLIYQANVLWRTKQRFGACAGLFCSRTGLGDSRSSIIAEPVFSALEITSWPWNVSALLDFETSSYFFALSLIISFVEKCIQVCSSRSPGSSAICRASFQVWGVFRRVMISWMFYFKFCWLNNFILKGKAESFNPRKEQLFPFGAQSTDEGDQLRQHS